MDLIGILAAGFGLAVLARWIQARTTPVALPSPDLDEGAEIAVHVAQHEANSRGHALGALHLVYGLLQVEEFQAAVTAADVDLVAAEARVLAALEAASPASEPTAADAMVVLARAGQIAYLTRRPGTIVDLWRYLSGSAPAALVAPTQELHGAIVFALVHGSEPRVEIAGQRTVNVVLRNDDYTTFEFVTAQLREVFGVAPAAADGLARETHEQGRAIVGAFPSDQARAKIETVRARARERAYPLWIGAEPT
ncbi:MAG TPA: ATP-dependent Clp protease adaptor ClpS [Kofleriaceae bacterium]